MSTVLRGFMLAVLAFAFASPAIAQLVNNGPSGEYFHDTATGLYWYDPAGFVGQSRTTIDAFVQASSIWQWATGAQIDALNGKSSSAGQTLEAIMGPRQYSLSNGGPRWIGYHASTSQPDGWIAQSFNSPGFTTIDATGWQHNVLSWGPGAWLVSSSSPVPGNSLSLSQPQGSGSVLVQVSGPASAHYYTAISFLPANATSPGQGWWNGLHISFIELVLQVQSGIPPFIGTLDATGSASWSLPAGSLSPTLPDAYAVTTFFDATWSTQLGVTSVETLNIM